MTIIRDNTPTNDYLRSLVDEQSERVDVEYKNWIDLSISKNKANIAKHLCAISNSGGGYIIFGKDDDGQFSEPHPSKLEAYSHDVINSIVKYYLTPSFECVLYRVKSSKTEKYYPVFRIPQHGIVPISARKDGPQDSKGRSEGIHQGVHYTRGPGPESIPVNTPELWRPIIHRCVINERSSLLASIGRLFDRPTEVNNLDILDKILDKAIDQWKKEQFSEASLVDPASNFCSFAFRFVDINKNACHFGGRLPELKRLVEDTAIVAGQASNLGWELFSISEVDLRPSVVLVNDAEAYQAVMVNREDKLLNAPAIWKVSREGYGVEVRGYHEDSWWLRDVADERRGSGSWRPGGYFSPSIEHLRVYQFVWFASQLCLNFKDVADIEFIIEYAGLKSRELADATSGSRYSIKRISAEDRRRVKVTTSVEALTSDDGKLDAAAKLLAPVGRLFDGWEITDQAIASTLARGVF